VISLIQHVETGTTSKKGTRGLTQCLQIHSRDIEDHPEIILDKDGEPIGPSDSGV